MNILIYGGNGWIGLQFVKILENLNIEFKHKNKYYINI